MPSRRDRSLLSPLGYDDDAESLRSPLSEQDSDSEDDDFLARSRTTLELAEYDRTVLEDEDETEKLLTRSGPTHDIRRLFSPNRSNVRIGKKEEAKRQRKKERDSRKARHEMRQRYGEDEMYEMEEGHRDDESSLLSASSSDLGEPVEEQYADIQDRQKVSWRKLTLVFSAIFVLFLIFLLGAYKASAGFRSSHSHTLLSNGTALFAPTTILISLDGFRADFLNRGLTPTLNTFIADGVSPQYMLPSFPSVTFPNHFTLVTGLYPESHGIVGNTFWDPELQEQFYYTHPSVSMQPKWWNAEPLWMTAENQGVRTAIHMWPGSEAHIGGVEPTYVDKFNGSEALPRKTQRILDLLDLPGLETPSESSRPQFIAAYVPNVDADGHRYGPNSTEIRGTISQADDMLAGLFSGLQERNLTDVVNIVIVSDHGMATTSTERLVQLDDLIDLDLTSHIDGWPLRGIRPKRPEDLQTLQDQLQLVASKYSDAIEIYTREDMPERYHFKNNDRIAPLWVIPKTGWAIVERPEFDAQVALQKGEVYHPMGIHGYDHEHPLMRAIFVARGPAFPHAPNSRVDNFQNINVYNILCDSLDITPHPNNGTLRLPLKPSGLHSDEDAPVLDNPSDPVADPSATETVADTHSTAPVALPSASSVAPASSSAKPEEDADNEPDSWWGKVWGKVEEVKDWASDLFESVKDDVAAAQE
ncbi:alkaline-phosphatase-like protein [Aspergillus californicus]